MKTVDVLKEARARIAIGWCRGRMRRRLGSKMCFCAIGAIEATGCSFEARYRAEAELVKTIDSGTALDSFSTISNFNDNSPSKKRVLDAFDQTIARLEGRS